ncbi:MAG: elongation factor G [Kiritimatiellia bacterium]|jgi:elongation factor G
MSNSQVSDIRNFVLVGHTGSGKTALADAFAFKMGLNDRLGSSAAGTSVSDYTDEEKARQISIFATPFSGEYTLDGKNYKIVFIDTPGAPDFYGQLRGAVRAADFAVIAVDAISGVQVGTRRAWRICQQNNLSAVAFVITGMDKDNADFTKAVNSIREAFGKDCVPVTAPLGGDIVNILDQAELSAELDEMKTYLAESAAETDEALMEKYFEEGTLPAQDIRDGLLAGIAGGSVRPIYTVMPLKDKGVDLVLASLCRLFPGPDKRKTLDIDGNPVPCDPSAPFVSQVWKTAVDPFVGQLSYVRVFSGTLKVGAALQNTTTGGKETAGALLGIVGKKQVPVESAGPGDLVAISKLKDTHTGDSLCAADCNTRLPDLEFPPPVMYVAVTAKTQNDEDKLSVAIKRLLEADPTLHYEKQAETKEILLKGLGDVHLDVAVSLMKSQSNVNVNLSIPKVPYRETIQGKGEGHYKHKKQSGGRGQYGEVFLRVRPRMEGEEEWFIDATVGGSIPGNFMPAIQKGIIEGMSAGGLAGSPVQNVVVEVYDGSFHTVDSSEVAFKIAGVRAFREAMAAAKPVLLEPVMTVKVVGPDSCTGAITGDLNQRRGRMLGMDVQEGEQVIAAEVPFAELFQYAAQLRSITSGQATFEMEFARYDVVPSVVAQKVIAEYQKTRKEDEDE